jgi:single-stranded DNA-binding protein
MFVLITGTLWKDPIARTSKAGKPFATAFVKAGTPADALFCNVVAFDKNAQAELLRLEEGDALSVQGPAKVGVFEKNGEHRASLEVIAAHVLALRQPPKPREAKPKPIAATPPGRPDFDDEIPEFLGGGL